MTKIPFSIAYRPQVESGEYKVVTREDCPIDIIKWDLKGEFPVVGVYYDEKNDRDTAVQVTAKGKCSKTPGEDYCDDFFIITEIPELTMFKKELETMLDYTVNHAKPGVNVVDIFVERIFESAKLEIEKNLPHWKKTNLPDGIDYALDEAIFSFNSYSISINELEKLPKEE